MLPLRVFTNKPLPLRLLSIVVVVGLILVAGIRVESDAPLRSLRGTVYYSNILDTTPKKLVDTPAPRPYTPKNLGDQDHYGAKQD